MQETDFQSDQIYETTSEGSVETTHYCVRIDDTAWEQAGSATMTSDNMFVEWLQVSDYDLQCSTRDEPYRRTGPILFVPPGEALRCRWSPGRTRTLSCSFSPDIVDGLPQLIESFAQIDHGAMLDVRSDYVKAALVRLAEEARAPDFGSALLVEGILTSLTVELHRALTREETPRDSQHALSIRQLERIRALLNAFADRTPSLNEMAAECGVPPRDLSTMMKRATGMTMRSYVASERVNKAKAMLADKRHLIKQVAYSCGFGSPAAFTAAFRRQTGQTPHEYRMQ